MVFAYSEYISGMRDKSFCSQHEIFIKPERATEHAERTGHTVTTVKVTAEPSMATMERWTENGVAKALDGCRVEPDGYCAHNLPSWIRKLGYI